MLEVIHKNEGLANKDKAKFESQINNLSDSGTDGNENTAVKKRLQKKCTNVRER